MTAQASAGRTSGLQVTLWWNAADYITATTPAKEDLLGGGNLVNEDDSETSNQVPCVTDIGDIAREANTIEYSCYGEDTSRKTPGITSLGDFTFVIALDNADTIHENLMGLAIGARMMIVIQTATNPGDPVTLGVDNVQNAGRRINVDAGDRAKLAGVEVGDRVRFGNQIRTIQQKNNQRIDIDSAFSANPSNTQSVEVLADRRTYDVIRGTLAGRTKSTPKDDVSSVTFTVAMSQAPVTIS